MVVAVVWWGGCFHSDHPLDAVDGVVVVGGVVLISGVTDKTKPGELWVNPEGKS